MPKQEIHFRNLKSISTDALASDFQHLSSNPADLSSVTEAVDYYNQSLNTLLDLHAPLKTRTVSFLRSVPWYTSELQEMKKGHVLERRFIASGLTVHKQAYIEHQKACAKSRRDARSQFYSNIINNSPGNSKKLFFTINHLLKPQALPLSEASEEQCNSFVTFFRKKVDSIRSLLSSSTEPPTPPDSPPTAWDCPISLLFLRRHTAGS
ncbi:hypothetical protein ABVT39_025321 [Epinephelus coioides]